jgi:hypothetical protein
MLISRPLEIKDEQGKGTGRWRMVEYSDEGRKVYFPLCDCEGGHASPKEAVECDKRDRQWYENE